MTVEFPRWRRAKPEAGLPCTTRTFASSGPGFAHLWEEVEASLQTEVSLEVLAEASSIASAERARTQMRDSLSTPGSLVTIACQGGLSTTGRISMSGSDFVVIQGDAKLATGIAAPMIMRVCGADHRLAPMREQSASPMTWMRWLRSLGEQAVGPVQSFTSDGWTARGEIRYVGADFLRIVDAREVETDVMISSLSALRVSKIHLAE